MTLFGSVDVVAKDDWTFRDADTRYFTHRYHDYPARMIPQIAEKLLTIYAPNADSVFDPYCGSGSVLVEGLLHGIETFGTDLNPLARLLAEVKTIYIDPIRLDRSLKSFCELVLSPPKKEFALPPWLDAERVSFWFKPNVVNKLLGIYSFIEHIENREVELFFLTAFSETIRECSNTRPGEFKLFRRPPEVLEYFDPDVYSIMAGKLGRNREAYQEMLSFMDGEIHWKKSHIGDFNTMDGIPEGFLPAGGVDIVITSPPYGDSHTTVAYGQFSRLSSEWLGYTEAAKVDSMLMGGKRLKQIPRFSCDSLNSAIADVAKSDKARATEIASFYSDLEKSIHNVADVVKASGVACYVVANRKVKGTVLPTDQAVISFFADRDFKHLESHYREIPNKRMPLKNSPSNEIGATDTTMVREIIVVVQKS
jgi:site-specific DNA-methyltransferase (cytosine-N4-specific)